MAVKYHRDSCECLSLTANTTLTDITRNPQQQAVMQKRALAMQAQAARGEQADGEMNGGRTSPSAEGDATGSPSKRPRMDPGQQNFQAGMMPNGRPAAVQGNPGQGMMIQAGFNPAMTQQFQRNGNMPPKNMQVSYDQV